MRRCDLEYDLPEGRIAQQPCEPRDAARLMVVDRGSGRISHRTFREVAEYLEPGDCLVLNDTRVIPARFECRRRTGGRVEALFIAGGAATWRVLLKPSRRLSVGEVLAIGDGGPRLELTQRGRGGEWSVRPDPPTEPLGLLERVGRTPLPPYIRRPGGPDAEDARRYQTVYARNPGAVAAPTAGLHFTTELLDRLRSAGVRVATITLHVGPGTFAPIESEELADHRLAAEHYEVTSAAARTIGAARAEGRRIVAVGTTTVRVLEATAGRPPEAAAGATDLFIYPPWTFRSVDRLITNFHLPGSTLLALTYAFGGVELVRKAYAEAVERDYRFYSYGDAMLIL